MESNYPEVQKSNCAKTLDAGSAQREIPRLMDEQEQCLDRLHNAIEELENQLEPVLRESLPESEVKQPSPDLDTYHGRRLNGHNNSMTQAFHKISNLQRRLEI